MGHAGPEWLDAIYEPETLVDPNRQDYHEYAISGGANSTGNPPTIPMSWATVIQPMPEPTYLVRELGMAAGAGPPHLVAGYGYSGKSAAMQAMLLALAADRPVWGAYSGLRGVRALHVDLEQGEALTRSRYARLSRSMGLTMVAPPRFGLLVNPSLRLLPGHEEAWLGLLKDYDVVLVDSLRVATPGLDENSSEIGEALYMLARVSEATGCRAVVIHHAGKPTESNRGRYSIRGSSAIYNAADGAYVLTSAKGEPIELVPEKARTHGELPGPMALTIADEPEPGEQHGNGRALDPRWGLTIRAHGAELVREAQRTSRSRATAATVAEKLRELQKLLSDRGTHGISQTDARAILHLTSGADWASLRAAWGDVVAVRLGGETGRALILYAPQYAPPKPAPTGSTSE